MAQNRVDNIQVNAPKDIDNKKGIVDVGGWRCYNNIGEAKLSIPVEIRYPTLIVNILKSGLPTEYWWRDGILDENLIEKISDIPDATNSIKGKLKLTNNLGGTADSPLVVAVETKDTSDSSIEQDSNQRNDNSEQDTDNGPSIYAGIKKHKTLLPKDVAFLYSRLQRLFADEYSVSPRVRMSQVLRPTANTLEDKGLREIFRMLHKTYFDFVLTDLHTCNIRIVLITEQQLDRTKNREFIIGLLCHLNIPVYSYERVANLSDNELVVQISEAIAGANYE